MNDTVNRCRACGRLSGEPGRSLKAFTMFKAQPSGEMVTMCRSCSWLAHRGEPWRLAAVARALVGEPAPATYLRGEAVRAPELPAVDLSEPVQDFVRARCVLDPLSTSHPGTIWEAFVLWAGPMSGVSRTGFYRVLRQMGAKHGQRGGLMVIDGIRLASGVGARTIGDGRSKKSRRKAR